MSAPSPRFGKDELLLPFTSGVAVIVWVCALLEMASAMHNSAACAMGFIETAGGNLTIKNVEIIENTFKLNTLRVWAEKS
jgi:hypothetical protein